MYQNSNYIIELQIQIHAFQIISLKNYQPNNKNIFILKKKKKNKKVIEEK